MSLDSDLRALIAEVVREELARQRANTAPDYLVDSSAIPRRIEATSLVSAFGGWIYAVALVPELDARRIKVGFTENPVGRRLAQYRTANPTALLVGLWEGDRYSEQLAHVALRGRIGASEVFHVENLDESLESIGRALLEPRS